jgi:uncharacterized membrane protein YdjX (TVP38/TMEM64 family)
VESRGKTNFLFFFIFVIIFIFAGRFFHFDPEHSRQFFSQYSPFWSGVVFLLLYVVGTFFIWFGPKDVLRVAALFIFGVMQSTVLIYIGEMLNMAALFWFSRKMGRPFVEAKAQGRIKQIEEAASQTSAAAIFFMKFYPVISFRLLDLGYGLTKISFLKYAVISLIASPLRLYIVQYFLDIMINFGLVLNADMASYSDRFMEMTYYLAERPVLFSSLTVYTFSAFIFFGVLFCRWKFKKKKDC